MITDISPKLPMRNQQITRDFYVDILGFQLFGKAVYDDYLMVYRDLIQIHFFEFKELKPLENYGQVYIRTNAIELLYSEYSAHHIIHPNGSLTEKPWGQKEFSILDPDHNLLTFGQDSSL